MKKSDNSRKGVGNQNPTSDNGWRPRFQLKDETKNGVLDLQMEILSKFYPTKESREQEQQQAAQKQDVIEEKSILAIQKDLPQNESSDLGDATTEVYTRLKTPKQKENDAYQTERRTRRRMPGASDNDDEVEEMPKRRGLRNTVAVEDDGEGNVGMTQLSEVVEKEEKKEEKPAFKETAPQDLFSFGDSSAPKRSEPSRPQSTEEQKSSPNVTQKLDRLFSDFDVMPQVKEPEEKSQEESELAAWSDVYDEPIEEVTSFVEEPVKEAIIEPIVEPVKEAIVEPVEEAIKNEVYIAPEPEVETSVEAEKVSVSETGSWSGGNQSLDDMLRDRVSIPVVDVMSDTSFEESKLEEESVPVQSTDSSVVVPEALLSKTPTQENIGKKKSWQIATEEEVPAEETSKKAKKKIKAEKPEKPVKEDSPTKKTLKRLLRLILPYSPIMIVSLVASAISVALQLYAPYLFGQIVDYAVGPNTVNTAAIAGIIQKLLIVIAACAAVQWVCEICNNQVTFRVVRDLRCKAFRHIQSLPLRYVDTKQHGELVNNVMTDVDQISDGLLLGFSQLFSGIVMIIGTLIFMIVIDWRVTIGVVVLTPLSLVVASQIANRTYNMFRQQSEDRGEVAAHVEEMIGNQKVVIAFGHEAESVEKFEELNEALAKSSRKATFFSSITNPSTRFVNSLVYAFVGVLGAIFAIQRTFSVGDLSCFLSYAKQYTKPFNEISGVIAELQNALACAGRVFELLDEPAEEPDEEGAIEILRVNGMVALEDVSFSYTPERPLIQNFNLQVQPGQRVAIVGPTGCGKTTLINLLMRFYDVNSGKIFVSGRNIMKLKKNSLRNQYGMVLQETWIRSGTIHDNIAYGKPGATREEVIEAAKAVHAHSFIRRLPEGYDTVLTEDGGNLSAGQKQLLCIARVMLKKPPMLILDEATSSIDTRTEIRIQKAFAKMMEGRTSFIVAHRLSTIQEADVILVMRDGNVVEQGTHDELLAQDGFYSELYYSQYATT